MSKHLDGGVENKLIFSLLLLRSSVSHLFTFLTIEKRDKIENCSAYANGSGNVVIYVMSTPNSC